MVQNGGVQLATRFSEVSFSPHTFSALADDGNLGIDPAENGQFQ
jgi:hypothetical protein